MQREASRSGVAAIKLVTGTRLTAGRQPLQSWREEEIWLLVLLRFGVFTVSLPYFAPRGKPWEEGREVGGEVGEETDRWGREGHNCSTSVCSTTSVIRQPEQFSIQSNVISATSVPSASHNAMGKLGGYFGQAWDTTWLAQTFDCIGKFLMI